MKVFKQGGDIICQAELVAPYCWGWRENLCWPPACFLGLGKHSPKVSSHSGVNFCLPRSICKGERPPFLLDPPGTPLVREFWKFWKPSTFGGACPRLSPVGGEAQKQPGETNTQTKLQTRDVFVAEKQRAHSALGPGCPSASSRPGAGQRSHLSWGLASPKPPATPGYSVGSLELRPDTSQSQSG